MESGINVQADVEMAAVNLAGKVDCINNLTDNTVVNALQTVINAATQAGIPVFGSEVEQVKAGCVASMGLEYFEFGMSGQEAEQTSEDIEALLRDICASTLPSEQYYDPAVTYNVYTKEELQQLYTNIDVNKMLETLRIDSVDTYIVEDVEQAQKINSLLTEENLEVLKNFSTFVMLNDAAEYSTQNYTNLKEQIDNQLHGVTASRGDEYIWMSLTQDMLPWDFGKIYVEEHFSEQSKQDVEAIIDRIIAEYEQIINRQEWMSDATKQKAIRKLETMSVKIGYPDEWPESMDMIESVVCSCLP